MTHFVCCLASRRGEARRGVAGREGDGHHRRPLQAGMASSDGAGRSQERRPTPLARWRRPPREGRQLEPEAGHWRRAAGFRLRGAGWPTSPRYCYGPKTSRRTRDLASPAGVRQRSRPHLCAVPHVPALAPRQMCRPQGSRHQPPRRGAGNLGLPRLPSDASRDAPRGPEAADPAGPTRTPTDTYTTATAANGEERRDPDGGSGTTGAAAFPTHKPRRADDQRCKNLLFCHILNINAQNLSHRILSTKILLPAAGE